MLRGARKIPPESRQKLVETLNHLDDLLSKSQWFAGSEVTIADISILGSISSVKVGSFTLCSLIEWLIKAIVDVFVPGVSLRLGQAPEPQRMVQAMPDAHRLQRERRRREISCREDFERSRRLVLMTM